MEHLLCSEVTIYGQPFFAAQKVINYGASFAKHFAGMKQWRPFYIWFAMFVPVGVGGRGDLGIKPPPVKYNFRNLGGLKILVGRRICNHRNSSERGRLISNVMPYQPINHGFKCSAERLTDRLFIYAKYRKIFINCWG